jgi:hypothetical protein
MASSEALVKRQIEKAVSRSPRDKGVTLTISVTVYDNGMINVNGLPQNHPGRENEVAWMNAMAHVTEIMRTFCINFDEFAEEVA